MTDESTATLDMRVDGLAATLTDGAIGVSVYDYLSGLTWSAAGARWFHAASIIKLAILAAAFDAIDSERFTGDSRVHVRNRFFSAHDGSVFRVDPGRDADAAVHAAIGRTLRVTDLARHMIAASSNLATNLLLNLVGLDHARDALQRRGIAGIDLQRGVEDDRAFEAGCSNRVTADGVVALLCAIHNGTGFSTDSSRTMMEILHEQQFAGGIAPGLPEAVRAVARVAHKTGDISSVSHDAGIVFLPGRPPYVVAILVQSAGDASERVPLLAAVSRAVYEAVAAAGEAPCR